MISHHLHNPVDRSEEVDEMEMTIDRDSVAHVMHIIRAQLYSDKVGSPIREYASNAVDAHVMDVVAVPRDCSYQKMRVCRYKVIKEIGYLDVH